MQLRRLRAAVAVAAAVTLAATGCAESQREGNASKDTLVFGAAGAPETFDPTFATDGETFRVVRQMMQTLVTHKPGTSELGPDLAKSWESTPDGKEWTFHLREGVKFHDGTDFNAEAVCFNYDRWHNLKGEAAQAQAIYYLDTFGGFANNTSPDYGESPYLGCEATDEHTAVIKLKEFQGRFPAAFSLTSLSISSPTALKKYDADNVTQEGESFNYPAYATKHPTGTGPYKFVSYDEANSTIKLVRNEDYWGEKAKIKNLIFKVIPDENARKQELRAGEIDGYDFPSPADYQSLKDDGFNVMVRDAFNIMYLGINQLGHPKLKDMRVRRAIAHALNREQLVKTKLPAGAEVAKEFIPDTVLGHADDVEEYPYDLDKAKALLKEAGAENLNLKFYYPTEVTRPYMPNPKEIFQVLADDLEKAGITIEPVAKPWTDYLDATSQTSKHDLHLLGWTGDYNDPINFIGTWFARPTLSFGTKGETDMFDAVANADSQVDEADKRAAWEDVNRGIMKDWLPGIPISHSPPALVVSPDVKGMVTSPLTQEEFAPLHF